MAEIVPPNDKTTVLSTQVSNIPKLSIVSSKYSSKPVDVSWEIMTNIMHFIILTIGATKN